MLVPWIPWVGYVHHARWIPELRSWRLFARTRQPSEVGPIPWLSGMCRLPRNYAKMFHNEGLTSNTLMTAVTLNSISISISIILYHLGIGTLQKDRDMRPRWAAACPQWGLKAQQSHPRHGGLADGTNKFKKNKIGKLLFFFECPRKYDTSPKSVDFFVESENINFPELRCNETSKVRFGWWFLRLHRPLGWSQSGERLRCDLRRGDLRTIIGWWDILLQKCCVFFWNVHYMFNRIYWNTSRLKKQSCQRGLFDGMLTVVSRGTLGWRSSP